MINLKKNFQINCLRLASIYIEKALYYNKIRYSNLALIGKAYENTLEFKLFESSEKLNMAIAKLYYSFFTIIN